MTPTTKAKAQPAPPEAQVELTLRDRLAMLAVAGCLSSSRHFDKDSLAEEAYALADAMLIARTKEPK